MLLLFPGCLSIKTEHDIKPIEINMNINLKIDKELDDYFDDIYGTSESQKTTTDISK